MTNKKVVNTNYAGAKGEKIDFARFVEIAKETIKDYLPDEYENAIVDVQPCHKLNESYLGMTVKAQKNTVLPTLNLNMFYDTLQHFHYDLEKIMKKMAEIVQIPPMEVDMDLFSDYEKAKKCLFIRVTDADRNQEILSNAPYTQVENLAITYHIFLDFEDKREDIASALVTNEMMRRFNISKDQLHQDAMENSPKLFPAKVESVSELMKNMMRRNMRDAGIREEDIDQMMREMYQETLTPLTIVTNEQIVNGASAIFYSGLMDQIGELLEGDYFIFPSSINEMLVCRDTAGMTSDELKCMVMEINNTNVQPEERLTNEVYHYDTKCRVFEKASVFEARMSKLDIFS